MHNLHSNPDITPPIACKNDVGGVLGVKDSMVAHVLGKGGGNPCPNASAAARNAARAVRNVKGKGKRELEEAVTGIGDPILSLCVYFPLLSICIT